MKTPRKFVYTETHYFGDTYSVNWTTNGLELSALPVGACSSHPDATVQVSSESFSEFIDDVKNLQLCPDDNDEFIADGFEVDCHITFRNRLVKFEIVNPNFTNFQKFRDLINKLTVCDTFPERLLPDLSDLQL